ncbi:hypothetical protein EGK76_08225 [Luteimonas sp. 100069]|nr:hypothetical protein EGK76_08225 [Luteimonas sp. 100069]
MREALAARRSSDEILIVGDAAFFAKSIHDLAEGDVLSPSRFLKFVDAERRSLRVLSFTDQLVSPEFASILVSRRGELEFYSAFERVAAARHQLPLFQMSHEASGDEDDGTRGYGDAEHVLAQISRYLDICAKLGEEWRAADLQEFRRPAYRIAAAKRRLRVYASIAMASCEDSGGEDMSAELLRPIFDARAQIARLSP